MLSRRALNRALLARQLLLGRTDRALPDALEQIGGIQAQYAPAMYVGAWSRIEHFERDSLTRGLEGRRVIQATLMRSTIHLVAAGDYWPFALAVREARRESWLRSVKDATPRVIACSGNLSNTPSQCPRAPILGTQTPPRRGRIRSPSSLG